MGLATVRAYEAESGGSNDELPVEAQFGGGSTLSPTSVSNDAKWPEPPTYGRTGSYDALPFIGHCGILRAERVYTQTAALPFIGHCGSRRVESSEHVYA